MTTKKMNETKHVENERERIKETIRDGVQMVNGKHIMRCKPNWESFDRFDGKNVSKFLRPFEFVAVNFVSEDRTKIFNPCSRVSGRLMDRILHWEKVKQHRYEDFVKRLKADLKLEDSRPTVTDLRLLADGKLPLASFVEEFGIFSKPKTALLNEPSLLLP